VTLLCIFTKNVPVLLKVGSAETAKTFFRDGILRGEDFIFLRLIQQCTGD
jgi:hypothetical protein